MSAVAKPILDGAKFDLGESVWLVGPPSYLIHPTEPIDYSNDKWRNRWHVSTTQISVLGIKIEPTLKNRLFYVFPGNGCSESDRMFRNREDAERAVKIHNESLA